LDSRHLQDQLLIDDIWGRWQEELAVYKASEQYDPHYTFRAVLRRRGLFGDHVGAITSHEPAKCLLRRLITGESPRYMFEHSFEFSSLGLCDLAASVLDDSMYEGFGILLHNDPRLLTADQRTPTRIREFLAESKLFTIRQSVNARRLFIASLCRFVPAYRVSPDTLLHLLTEALRRFRSRSLEHLVAPTFRDELLKFIETSPGISTTRAGEMVDPFLDLLVEVRRVLEFAVLQTDLPALTPDQLALRYRRTFGTEPLEGLPIRLVDVWDDLLALAGITGSTRRATIRGLQECIRLDRVTHFPNGQPLHKQKTLGLPNRDIPWGLYPVIDGTRLLVSQELLRFDEHVLKVLATCALPEPNCAEILQVQDDIWIVAAWPFCVHGLPPAYPLLAEGTNGTRFLSRVPSRAQYVLYGRDEHRRRRVILTGPGRDRTPRPFVQWRLVFTVGGFRIQPSISVPFDGHEASAQIFHNGSQVAEIVPWISEFSEPIADVAPNGVLDLRSMPKNQLFPLGFESPKLFVPNGRTRRWDTLEPHQRLPRWHGAGHLVGPSDSKWRVDGMTLGTPQTLGPGWDQHRLWPIEQLHTARVIQIATPSRELWRRERGAYVEMTLAGDWEHAGSEVRYCPGQTKLVISGLLGQFEPSELLGDLQLVLSEGDHVIHVTIPVTGHEINWEKDLEGLLSLLGPSDEVVRRWSVTIVTPEPVFRASEGSFDFCRWPQIQLAKEPHFKPGDKTVQLHLIVPKCGELIEIANPNTAAWVPLSVINGKAICEHSIDKQILDTRRLMATLRIGGTVFPNVIDTPITVTGLAIKNASQLAVLCHTDAMYEADITSKLVFEGIGLANGESIEIKRDGDDAPCWRLDAKSLRVTPFPDEVRVAESSFLASWIHGGHVTTVGQLKLRLQPSVERLTATIGAGAAEIDLKCFIPVGLWLKVILVNPSGNDEDEQKIIGIGESIQQTIRLLLPLDEDPGRYRVEVFGPGRTSIAVCPLKQIQASTDPVLERFSSQVKKARAGEAIQPNDDHEFEGALARWTRAPHDTAALTAYLDALLAMTTSREWQPLVDQEIGRCVEALDARDRLAWHREQSCLRRLERLLTLFSAGLRHSKIVNRVAALVALAAAERAPSSSVQSPLYEHALALLQQGAVLRTIARLDRLWSVISPKQIAEALRNAAQDHSVADWEGFAHFAVQISKEHAVELIEVWLHPGDHRELHIEEAIPAIIFGLARLDHAGLTPRKLYDLSQQVEDSSQPCAHKAREAWPVQEADLKQQIKLCLDKGAPSLTPDECIAEWHRNARLSIGTNVSIPLQLRTASHSYCLAESSTLESVQAHLIAAANLYRLAIAGKLDVPWSRLAPWLEAMCYLRAGRIGLFVEKAHAFQSTTDDGTALASLGFDIVRRILDNLLMRPSSTTNPARPHIQMLSPRTDDGRLFALLLGASDMWQRLAEEDWAVAWLAWRASHWHESIANQRAAFFESLQRLRGLIPMADLKLTEEIDSLSPGVWNV